MAEEDKINSAITIPEGALAKAETQSRHKADNFTQIYANNLHIGFSSFDMAITFGQIIGQHEGKTVIEESLRVLITREMGKLLAGLLTGNIAAYEQQFGEIKIPTPMIEGEAADEDQDFPPERAMTRAARKTSRKRGS